jgi:cell wall-associated NlpC family hydrolase
VPSIPRSHPQAIEPVAGAAAAAAQPSADQAGVSVGPPSPSLPQPVTVTQVRQELAQSGMTASASQATLTAGGLALAPIGAPAAVQAVIAAGNQIARLPYHWGGGHMTYEDTGYDCSGSISYVFAAAHLLIQTVTSGELVNYGQPGPGKWITIFANAGHTFMIVAGLRFDTVALAETGSRWSNRRPDENLSAFSVRHPPGL